MTQPLVDVDFGLAAGGVDSVAGAFEQVRAKAEAVRQRTLTPTGAADRPWPLLPSVSVLNAAAESVLRERIAVVVGCLEQVVRRYPVDAELQDFLAVPPQLRRWVLAQPEPWRLRVDCCRVDLLGDTLDEVRALEFNASSPGGLIATGMINRFWWESDLGARLARAGAVAAPFERPGWFADWLLDHGARRGLAHADTLRVGLFHPAVSSRGGFDLIAEQLRALGRTPVVLQPSDVDDAKELRLGYFKHIPRDLDEIAAWDVFCGRVADGDLVVPNLPATRWVAENKLCLAVLSDPRFRWLFTHEQCRALDALIPYSRKLGDGISAAEAIAERARLVLKSPYDAEGRSVVIGAGAAPDEWADAVRERAGWLIQRRVTTRPLATERGPLYRDLTAPVVDGEVIGYFSRMSAIDVVNIAQGGSTAAVLVQGRP
ncbi:hypothetical protein [Actinokineospora sp. NPDC004072]